MDKFAADCRLRLILVIETIPMTNLKLGSETTCAIGGGVPGSWTYIVFSLIMLKGERQARLARLNVSTCRSHGKTRVRWASRSAGNGDCGMAVVSGGWSESETCGTASTRLLEVF
jgi:hypothetical protein